MVWANGPTLHIHNHTRRNRSSPTFCSRSFSFLSITHYVIRF